MSKLVPAGRAGGFLRVLLAAGVLALLLWQIDIADIAREFAALDARWLGVAFVAGLLECVGKIYNWRQLLLGLRIDGASRYSQVACCYFSGAFLGTVVPSSAGTDALRALLAKNRFGGDVAPFAASVVTLNVLGLGIACCVGLLGVLLFLPNGRGGAMLGVGAVLFTGVIGIVAFIHALLRYQRGVLAAGLRRIPPRGYRIRRAVRKFIDSLRVVQKAHVPLAQILGVSALSQLARIAVVASLAAATGLFEPYTLWMFFVPLMSLASLIPASIAGFGGEQATTVYALVPFGIAPAEAFVISTLIAMLNLTYNVGIGGSTFAFCRSPTRLTASPIPLP